MVSTRVPALRSLLPALAVLALLGACDDGPPDPDLNGEDPPAVDDDRGAVTSEGCSADAVIAGDGSTCATCEGAQGSVDICGPTLVARCTEQENVLGQPCQRCVANGMVLFDDCVVASSFDEDALHCEAVEAGNVPETDGAHSGSVSDDGLDCQVCTDETGAVIRSYCQPQADECHETTLDGRACTECTYQGELAYLDCEPPNLDPDVCEVYENDAGRCIDCYQGDDLIVHTCTLFDDPGAGQRPDLCTSYPSADGLFCTECYDLYGNLIDFYCDSGGPAAPQFCEELRFDEANQVCLVCVNQTGGLASSECYDSDCLTSGFNDPTCGPPAPCTFVYGAGGELCRECPVVDNTGAFTGQVETECLSGQPGNEHCYEVVESMPVPEQPDDPSGDPVVVEVICIECADDAGNVTYRECSDGSGGTAPPPTCVYEVDANGDECLVCFDPFTGDLVIDDCYGTEPGGMCTFLTDVPVPGPNGSLTLAAPDGSSFPAVATCDICTGADANFAEESTRCTLQITCDGYPVSSSDPDPNETDPGSGGGFIAPEPGLCPDVKSYSYELPQCGAPWAALGDATMTHEDALLAMGWLYAEHQILAYDAVTWVAGPAEECASCACSSGRVLVITAASDDATWGTMVDLGFTDL